ncbi:MAG: F0F1 ATP synthase subunit gamma [Candidatus Latescibacterota bacterium]
METLESLRRKIHNADDLFSVVRTMKTLAAVNIRHFERAVESLDDYNRTIEMGLRIVLQGRQGAATAPRMMEGRIGAVVFGSEQGLSGQFNDLIVTFTRAWMEEQGFPPERRTVLALGDRVVAPLEESQPVQEQLPFPNSLPGIPAILQEVLTIMERWRFQEGIEQVVLFYNRPLSGASYRPEMNSLLPVDENWMRNLEQEKWKSRTLPMIAGEREQLLSVLIRQYLFIALYRAFVHSMASENASRLASMQAAEKNIRDRLDELNTGFHHQRQSTVTAELLDIIGGYEALEGYKKGR